MSTGPVMNFGLPYSSNDQLIAGVPSNDLGAVLYEYDGGAFAMGSGGQATMSLAGTNPGTMAGTLTTSTENAVAVFGDVVFSAPGDYHVRVSDADGFSVATTVHVLPASRRASLAIISGPTIDADGTSFSLTLAVLDSAGHLAVNDPDDSYLGVATAAYIGIATGPANGDPAVVGPDNAYQWVSATVNADGTQTFHGLRVTAAGTYTFTVGGVTTPGSPYLMQALTTDAITLPATADPRPAAADPAPTPPVVTSPVGPTPPDSPPVDVIYTPIGQFDNGIAPVVATQSKREQRKLARGEARAERVARRAEHAAAVAKARADRAAAITAKRATRVAELADKAAAAEAGIAPVPTPFAG